MSYDCPGKKGAVIPAAQQPGRPHQAYINPQRLQQMQAQDEAETPSPSTQEQPAGPPPGALPMQAMSSDNSRKAAIPMSKEGRPMPHLPLLVSTNNLQKHAMVGAVDSQAGASFICAKMAEE